MTVQFLKYSLTGSRVYKEGEIADLEETLANRLLEAGVAVAFSWEDFSSTRTYRYIPVHSPEEVGEEVIHRSYGQGGDLTIRRVLVATR